LDERFYFYFHQRGTIVRVVPRLVDEQTWVCKVCQPVEAVIPGTWIVFVVTDVTHAAVIAIHHPLFAIAAGTLGYVANGVAA
jgi:hypothetical protein